MSDEKKWTHERKKLLIATRLRHEVDFGTTNKKRFVNWETILKEIKEVDSDFPFSQDEISRCFLNIMVTYKRIKKRSSKNGKASTSWEFFQDIDEVFGRRNSNQIPFEMLECTLSDSLDSSASVEVEDVLAPIKSMKRKKNEVLDFLQIESKKDKKMLKKILKIESSKVKVEKEKVSELKKIRVLLERMAER